MITPSAIQNKEFTKGVRGYKEDEVDKFLDLITIDLDTILQENRGLKERISELNAVIDRYRGTEGMLFDTLESAKKMMDDISVSAEKRAEIVLKNAELEAVRIQREARESVEKMVEEAVDTSRRWEQFKSRYKDLLQNELSRFDSIVADMFIEPVDKSGFYSDLEPIAPKAVSSNTTIIPNKRGGPVSDETFKTKTKNK